MVWVAALHRLKAGQGAHRSERGDDDVGDGWSGNGRDRDDNLDYPCTSLRHDWRLHGRLERKEQSFVDVFGRTLSSVTLDYPPIR